MTNRKQLEAKLTDKQKYAALLLIQKDFNEYYDEKTGEKQRITKDDVANIVGVQRITIYRWEHENEAFIAYKNMLSDQFLKSKRSFVHSQLLKAMGGSQPSVNAMKLYLQMEGLLVDKQIIQQIEKTTDKSTDDLAEELREIDALLADLDEPTN